MELISSPTDSTVHMNRSVDQGCPNLSTALWFLTVTDGIKYVRIQGNLTFDLIFTCLSPTRAVGFLSSLKDLHFPQRACWAVLD